MDQIISNLLGLFWRVALAIKTESTIDGLGTHRSSTNNSKSIDWNFSSFQQSSLLSKFCFVLFALSVSSFPNSVLAQVSREYAIKSAYMYNFGTYIKWPDGAFNGANAPFEICVVGNAPIDNYINRYIQQDKRINGRKIKFTKVAGAANLPTSHIVYLSKDLAADVKTAVVEKLKGKPTLLLSDDANFVQQGGGIRYTFVAGKIKLEIAPKSIKARNLQVNARLIQVCTVKKE